MSILSNRPVSSTTLHRLTAPTTGRRGWLISGVALALWVLLLSVLAYQFPASSHVVIGDYYDLPYLDRTVSARETVAQTGRTFRWTTGDTQVRVPGIGGGAWVVALNLLTAHPDGSPVDGRVQWSDGHSLVIPDAVEPRLVRMFVPPSAMASGDLRLTLRSKLYREPTASARTLGVALFDLAVTPAGARPLVPAWSMFGLLSLIVLGAALTLRATGLPGGWAIGVAAAIGAGLTWTLAFGRVPHTFWLPGLAVLAGLTLLLVLALRRIVPWLMARGGVDLDDRALTALLLLFVAGFWLKASGQLYPYMIAIDIHWHMDRVRWILDGRLAEMYRPGAFNESVMPASEYGENRPTIPYSPFFHIFATSFALLPFQLETTAKIFSSLIDCSYVFLIYFLGCSFSLSRRVALLAAAMYNVIPLTYLLHSWGNVPTTFGMWWVFITIAFIVGAWGTLHRRKVWLGLAGLMTTTFLMYTVMAVFLALLLIFWLSYIAWSRRDQRAQVWGVAKAALGGVLVSTLIYYGLYIPDIINKTIPYFSTTFTQGQEAVGAVQYQPTYADNFRAYGTRLWNNGLLFPLVLSPLGLWMLARRRMQLTIGKLWLGTLWMCAMFTVSLLFIPIDRSVPMVDKHIIFLIPVFCLLMATLMDWALRRWRWSAVPIGLAYAVLLIVALNLWVFRIENVKQVW